MIKTIALNGTWTCNDGGIYCIRETNIGNSTDVFWYGHSKNKSGFKNVFKGSVNPNGDIGGIWADIPTGSNNAFGELTLKLGENKDGDPILTAVNQTGGYGGTLWTKEKKKKS